MKLCPHCNNEHPDDAKFCPITGKTIPAFDAPRIAGAALVCKNCQTRLPANAQFCPVCGAARVGVAGAEPGGLQVGDFIRKNAIKLAGIGIILILMVLAFFSLIGKKTKVIPLQLPLATQTRTALLRETAGLTTLLVTKTVPPTEAQPTNTISLLVPSPQPTQPIPTSFPTLFPTMDISCPGAPPIRVEAGDLVRVTTTEGDKLNLRSSPKVVNNIIDLIPAGTKLRVISGPNCSDNSTFWEIQILESTEQGWVMEGDLSLYYIEPIY
jgi:RNA polymerase subunit RPABC4/transcription elongation factor Spt4